MSEQPSIVYEVCIDFDAGNWAQEPDFSESYDTVAGTAGADGANLITGLRGKEKEAGNAPAATIEIQLVPGLHEKYSPYTNDANLAGKIRPWLPVRVRAYHLGQYKPLFAGFISAWRIKPHAGVQSVVLYCTDGMDLLARQMIAQDPNDITIESDGDAIDQILNAAGWNASRRDIDKSGGSELLGYPSSYSY